jgi:hypothetical protein
VRSPLHVRDRVVLVREGSQVGKQLQISATIVAVLGRIAFCDLLISGLASPLGIVPLSHEISAPPTSSKSPSANRPVRTRAHWSFGMLPVLGALPCPGVLFLDRGGTWLESGQIHRIGFYQSLRSSNDLCDTRRSSRSQPVRSRCSTPPAALESMQQISQRNYLQIMRSLSPLGMMYCLARRSVLMLACLMLG